MSGASLPCNSPDGTRLNLYRWGQGPDVLIVHGQGEHGQRYDHVGQYLAGSGFRVTLVELRGHGQSGGLRGHVANWSRYSEDVAAAVHELESPYAMVAHSMGGLVTLDYLRQNLEPEPIGVVLSNPLVGLAFEPDKVKTTAAQILTRVFPELALTTDLDTNKLSRDPAVVRAYNDDPEVIRRVSVRWYTEMVAAIGRVRDGSQFKLPLLMLVGSSDGITSPQASEALVQSWGGPKVMHVYEGFYHELFNEPEK
ncbi:MAG TPA: alpha/beta hydrolase, partial [Candidatus Xenobia bacterium]